MPMTPAPQKEIAQAPEVPGLDVKEEPPAPQDPLQVVVEIDLVTSDSETSTSGDDFAESEAEDEQELEPAGHDVLNEDYNDVQQKKTKIIHAIKDMGHQVSDSVYECMPIASLSKTRPLGVADSPAPTSQLSRKSQTGRRSAVYALRVTETLELSCVDPLYRCQKVFSWSS